MGGKYAKNKAKKKKTNRVLWIALFVALGLFLAAVLLVLLSQPRAESGEIRETAAEETVEILPETTAAVEAVTEAAPTEPQGISLNNGLAIMDIGTYTGIYMEDGTDELVTGVLMMKLVNYGSDAVEYAKITVDTGAETAEFTVTTLKPGAEVVLLEKSRMAYDRTVDYTAARITCDNLALFQNELSLHEDKLKIQILDGAINVINVSDEDISGRIAIYYKNKAAGIYYGGITYRIVLENGLQAGEVRQMMASHFSGTGSEIIFVTIAP